jgi:hypothetical protein
VVVVEDPQPPPKSIGAALAVVVVVDVVGLAPLHAFDDPQASKLEVRFMEGDLAAAGTGAGAGVGWERLKAEVE